MPKFLLLPLAMLLASCGGAKTTHQSLSQQDQMEKPSTGQQALPSQVQAGQLQEKQAPIKQGVTGRVVMQSGNQMPSPNAPMNSGKRGVQRTVYIYELTNGSQTSTQDGVFHTNIQTNLVSQVVTDANGNFSVSLKPGKYSLFTKEEKGLYANLFDGENNIFPVEVQQGQVTDVEFLINYNASY